MKRTKFSSTAKSNRLPSSWRLFMDALRTYLDNWWGIWKIILVVYVPVGIISLITGPNDTVLSPFLGFAQIIMNIALIYAVAQLFENRPLPNTPTAYYDGSGVIVRYLLVLFL
ncbi:MAG TPA: hypothetical protein VI322_00430, partial [Candidatus Saccharimonadia bacterium]